jgi:integrase
MPQLTAAKVRSVTEKGRYGDGAGLYLYVTKSGSKSWVQRIVVNGRRRDIGLGGYPTIGLAEARTRAAANRVVVAEARDPVAEKRRPPKPTFKTAAHQVHQANLPRWRNPKHAAAWIRTLERFAFPAFGNMPVDQIARADVLAVLTPIWSTTPETARRVRQRIRTVMRWAMAHGFIENNPAGEAIDGALPPMPRVKDSLRALPYREISEALKIVEASRSSDSARLCLEFIVLTAARSGEARGALWSEMDLDQALWHVPAARMKGGLEHRVPLSTAALDVVARARKLHDGSDLVFPSPRRTGQPLSDMTLTKVLRDNGLSHLATVHGFRSTFRDWGSETEAASDRVLELALAHRPGNEVERAYARSDLLELRRPVMEAWGEFVCGVG